MLVISVPFWLLLPSKFPCLHIIQILEGEKPSLKQSEYNRYKAEIYRIWRRLQYQANKLKRQDYFVSSIFMIISGIFVLF